MSVTKSLIIIVRGRSASYTSHRGHYLLMPRTATSGDPSRRCHLSSSTRSRRRIGAFGRQRKILFRGRVIREEGKKRGRFYAGGSFTHRLSPVHV